MATALILLCAGATRSSRASGFPAPDDALDERSRRDAGQVRLEARFRANLFVSPARGALETAEAMGLQGSEEPALVDINYGSWAGRSFAAVHAEAGGAFARWLTDPAAGTLEGEPMEAVKLRIGRWLGRIADLDRPVCAITHATPIRSALAYALDLPLRSTLAIDIAPLSCVKLSFNRVWRLQSLTPFD